MALFTGLEHNANTNTGSGGRGGGGGGGGGGWVQTPHKFSN